MICWFIFQQFLCIFIFDCSNFKNFDFLFFYLFLIKAQQVALINNFLHFIQKLYRIISFLIIKQLQFFMIFKYLSIFHLRLVYRSFFHFLHYQLIFDYQGFQQVIQIYLFYFSFFYSFFYFYFFSFYFLSFHL